MTEVKSDKPGQRPPFPLTTPDEGPPLPRRPWIVRAYLVVSVASLGYGIGWSLAHDRLSLFATIWAIAFTAFAVLLIWNASRVSWSFLTAWTALSIPFVLRDEGPWLYLSVAIHAITLSVLLSPWMIRWIWRDGRRNRDMREQ